MTATEPPPVDHEPDHVLEQQAWADGITNDRPRNRKTALYDADAEVAVLGAMLISIAACDTVLDQGLDAAHFYSPRHATIYDAICRTLAADEIPDPVTVPGRLTDPTIDPRDLINLVAATPSTSNAWSYARRIIRCAEARQLQGNALEVAQAASTGNIDEALRLLDQLRDHLPADTTSTWAPIDISTILDGNTAGPEPTIGHVTGAPALFYAGRTNSVFGESGAGKTWVVLAAIVEAINDGHDAMVIDLEDTAAGLVARLLALGLTPDQIRQHFIYIQPDTAWSTAAQAQISHLITERAPTVVVIDSTGEAMAIDGVKGNDDDDVARWFTTFPKYIARLGPAVILTDHIPKASDAPLLYQIGSQRKRAAIDGASYRIDAAKEPSRTTDGLLMATTAKDRHGHHTKGQKAAQITLTHDGPDRVTVTLAAPEAPPTDNDGNMRFTIFMERISILLEDGMARSSNTIEKEIRGRAKSIRAALGALVAEGYVTMTSIGNGFSYRSDKPYRQDQDPLLNTDEEATDAA